MPPPVVPLAELAWIPLPDGSSLTTKIDPVSKKHSVICDLCNLCIVLLVLVNGDHLLKHRDSLNCKKLAAHNLRVQTNSEVSNMPNNLSSGHLMI